MYASETCQDRRHVDADIGAVLATTEGLPKLPRHDFTAWNIQPLILFQDDGGKGDVSHELRRFRIFTGTTCLSLKQGERTFELGQKDSLEYDIGIKGLAGVSLTHPAFEPLKRKGGEEQGKRRGREGGRSTLSENNFLAATTYEFRENSHKRRSHILLHFGISGGAPFLSSCPAAAADVADAGLGAFPAAGSPPLLLRRRKSLFLLSGQMCNGHT